LMRSLSASLQGKSFAGVIAFSALESWHQEN
jgi:hypothetical protein